MIFNHLMKNTTFKTILIVAILLTATFSSSAFAKDLIGSGYYCENGVILKGNRGVKLGIAKNAINNKIAALGTSKKDKAKKAALKGVRAGLTSCAKGGVTTVGVTPTPTPDPVNPSRPSSGDDKRCLRFPKFCNR